MSTNGDTLAKKRLRDLESTIEQGLETFVDVGRALLEIRDQRLYHDAGYDSFEVYCDERWGMSKTQANRLVQAVEVIDNLTPIGVTLPTCESQARPLAKLTPSEQRRAWKIADKNAPERNGQKRITCKVVTEAVSQVAGNGDAKPMQVRVIDKGGEIRPVFKGADPFFGLREDKEFVQVARAWPALSDEVRERIWVMIQKDMRSL